MKVQYGFCFYVGRSSKGSLVCKGDLLKPVSWNQPKHSRGNIFDGTDKWSFYGPTYL